MSILALSSELNSTSPLDSIRQYDEKGGEFWKARKLQGLLGYKTWQKFEDAIDRAVLSCENSGELKANHFNHLPGSVKSSGRTGDDWRLSKNACRLIAMNGDPRKVEIALAQAYFSARVQEAETIIPAQSDRIQELQMELEIERLKNRREERQDFRISAYGLPTTLLLEGKSDSVIEVDRPILEVIDQQSGTRFSGQTTKQLANYLNKNSGRLFKSGADVERELNRLGRADLIDTVPRKSLQPFVNKENLKEACDLLVSSRQQQLL
jgi:hypothetical protein